MPAPPAPPLPLPEATGAEGFAASLGVRDPRKYQTPRAMPAITSNQTHQRLLDGLSAGASVAVWPPDSGRSIDLSCPIHPLLTGSKCTSLVRASLQKAGPSWELQGLLHRRDIDYWNRILRLHMTARREQRLRQERLAALKRRS